MIKEKAKVYFFQERTPDFDDDGKEVKRRFGTQLVLGDEILAERFFEEFSIGTRLRARESGQYLREQIENRDDLEGYDILFYQRHGGACMSEGELSRGVDALIHIRKGFELGISG